MVPAVFAIPGDIASPTGGYAYARRVQPLFAGEGVDVSHLVLPDSFPHPGEADLAATRRLLAEAARNSVLLVDGLALGAIPPALIADIAPRIVALVHHPLGLETGLHEARARELLANEAAVLALCPRIVATSRTTARTLVADFGVAEAQVSVAEPGTDPAPPARGSDPGQPLALLAVGSVSPRKAYRLLVEALADIPRTLEWRLVIAGSDRDVDETGALRALIAERGLRARVEIAGPVPEEALAALYDGADLFVSASLYEGYGMVLAEAMARGLPMVVSTGGAAAQTVPDAAALKVPPGDVAALRSGLEAAIGDKNLRARLAAESARAGAALPRWEDTARVLARAIVDIGLEKAQ
ncbi:MAG: glycosyltransferase [Salinarimonadaceae bacterium]|nr:MAG: glycosyltransferase [Salinarimonadaceae bacterium]